MPARLFAECRTFIRRVSSCFFFSSRRRHTRYIGDWSSDVCSSDLHFSSLSEEKCRGGAASPALAIEDVLFPFVQHAESVANFRQGNIDGTRKLVRSEERRVGKACGY